MNWITLAIAFIAVCEAAPLNSAETLTDAIVARAVTEGASSNVAHVDARNASASQVPAAVAPATVASSESSSVANRFAVSEQEIKVMVTASDYLSKAARGEVEFNPQILLRTGSIGEVKAEGTYAVTDEQLQFMNYLEGYIQFAAAGEVKYDLQKAIAEYETNPAAKQLAADLTRDLQLNFFDWFRSESSSSSVNSGTSGGCDCGGLGCPRCAGGYSRWWNSAPGCGCGTCFLAVDGAAEPSEDDKFFHHHRHHHRYNKRDTVPSSANSSLESEAIADSKKPAVVKDVTATTTTSVHHATSKVVAKKPAYTCACPVPAAHLEAHHATHGCKSEPRPCEDEEDEEDEEEDIEEGGCGKKGCTGCSLCPCKWCGGGRSKFGFLTKIFSCNKNKNSCKCIAHIKNCFKDLFGNCPLKDCHGANTSDSQCEDEEDEEEKSSSCGSCGQKHGKSPCEKQPKHEKHEKEAAPSSCGEKHFTSSCTCTEKPVKAKVHHKVSHVKAFSKSCNDCGSCSKCLIEKRSTVIDADGNSYKFSFAASGNDFSLNGHATEGTACPDLAGKEYVFHIGTVECKDAIPVRFIVQESKLL